MAMKTDVEAMFDLNTKYNKGLHAAIKDCLYPPKVQKALEKLREHTGLPLLKEHHPSNYLPTLTWHNGKVEVSVGRAEFAQYRWASLGRWQIDREKVTPEITEHLDYWTTVMAGLWRLSLERIDAIEYINHFPFVTSFLQSPVDYREVTDPVIAHLLARHAAIYPSQWAPHGNLRLDHGFLRGRVGPPPEKYRRLRTSY